MGFAHANFSALHSSLQHEQILHNTAKPAAAIVKVAAVLWGVPPGNQGAEVLPECGLTRQERQRCCRKHSSKD